MPPSAHADTRLTYEDLEYFPDDGKRREIIDGELYVTPSPNLRHQALVGRLYVEIANYLAARPGPGRVYLSPLDVVLSPHDVVEPDLLFVGSDQLAVLTPKNVRGAPALVVEILSRGTRKTDEQAALRARGSPRVLARGPRIGSDQSLAARRGRLVPSRGGAHGRRRRRADLAAASRILAGAV